MLHQVFKHLEVLKKTLCCAMFFFATHFSGFGNPIEILLFVFDILHESFFKNNTCLILNIIQRFQQFSYIIVCSCVNNTTAYRRLELRKEEKKRKKKRIWRGRGRASELNFYSTIVYVFYYWGLKNDGCLTYLIMSIFVPFHKNPLISHIGHIHWPISARQGNI